MIWFVIAVVLAVIVAIVVGLEDGVEEGFVCLAICLGLFSLAAVVPNLLLGGVAHNVKVRECNLQKIGDNYLAFETDSQYRNSVYYRCEDDNKFSPESLSSSFEIKKGPVAKLEVYDNKTTGNQNWWSAWDLGGKLYVLTVPDTTMSLGLDKSAAK